MRQLLSHTRKQESAVPGATGADEYQRELRVLGALRYPGETGVPEVAQQEEEVAIHCDAKSTFVIAHHPLGSLTPLGTSELALYPLQDRGDVGLVSLNQLGGDLPELARLQLREVGVTTEFTLQYGQMDPIGDGQGLLIDLAAAYDEHLVLIRQA
jgi:hypothetical protein